MTLLVYTVPVELQLNIDALWIAQVPSAPGVQTVLPALLPAPFPNACSLTVDHDKRVGRDQIFHCRYNRKIIPRHPNGETGSVLSVFNSIRGAEE